MHQQSHEPLRSHNTTPRWNLFGFSPQHQTNEAYREDTSNGGRQVCEPVKTIWQIQRIVWVHTVYLHKWRYDMSMAHFSHWATTPAQEVGVHCSPMHMNVGVTSVVTCCVVFNWIGSSSIHTSVITGSVSDICEIYCIYIYILYFEWEVYSWGREYESDYKSQKIPPPW